MWKDKTSGSARGTFDQSGFAARSVPQGAARDPFGRILPAPEPDPEIADLSEPAKLESSVGEKGLNGRRDVAKVETMLGKAGVLDLQKTDGPTGYWGMRTADATRTFQKKHGLKVDGQINPGGETIRTLMKAVGNTLGNTPGNALGNPLGTPPGGLAQPTPFMPDPRNADPAEALRQRRLGRTFSTEIKPLNVAASEDEPAEEETPPRETAESGIGKIRRDIKEGFLRAGAEAGDAVGLKRAARYLKHFLDGSGEDIVVPRDEAREDPFIRESEAENRTRVENNTFLGKTNNDKLNDKIRSIQDGQTIDFDDDWDRELSFGNVNQTEYGDELKRLLEPDRLLAFGSIDFKSTVDAKATRDGDVVRIEGTVTHSGDDKYDFKDNGESFGAFEVQQSGRSKPYWVLQNWQQRVVGTVKVLGKDRDGKLILGEPQFEWEEID